MELTSGEIDGNPVRIYNKERTICDCLRYRKKMAMEIFVKAIQGYVNDTPRNIPRIIKYSNELQ